MGSFDNAVWYQDKREQGKRVADALWTENENRDPARVVRQITSSWREQHPDGPRFDEEQYLGAELEEAS